MGFFKKRKDPISQRSKTLNHQIAALQAEIERLSDAPEEAERPEPPKSAKPFSKPAAPEPSSRPPKLRSTTIPGKELARRARVAARSAAAAPDPVFEKVSQTPASERPEPATPAHYNDLGVRKYDLASLWKRLQAHFRGPATNNPKLVNYLAAGSIQGLRPLRYEKRVARNRFMVFVVFLIAVIWGLIVVWMKRR